MALGLKCGGTLEERASRLFSTKGKGLNELDPTLFAKSKGKASTAHRSAKELEKNREIAAMEAQVYRFAEILSEQRAATKENVERKQARTELEREDSDEDEDDLCTCIIALMQKGARKKRMQSQDDGCLTIGNL